MNRLERCAQAISSIPGSSLPGSIDGADVSKIYKASAASLSLHLLPCSEVLQLLGVDPRRGVSAAQAAARFDKFGGNTPSSAELALLAGSQQYLAWAMEATVATLRDGALAELPLLQLVVGDVVVLEAGERLPADVRIVYSESLVGLQPVFAAGEGWKAAQAELPTVVDATVPNGLGPQNVTSGAVKKQAVDKASNVALRGNTVLSGRLVGVVFATGSRCILAQTKEQSLELPAAPKLTRGTDKKKLYKVANKIESLGMKIRNPEAAAPLCGARNLSVVISVQRKLLPALNVALPKLVGQAFHIVLLLRPEVDAAKDIRQIANLAIGKPIDFGKIHLLSSVAALGPAVEATETESAVLATGPDMVGAELIKALEEKWKEPSVFFSDHIGDRAALERATLGCCLFTATGGLLQVANAVLGTKGLERLVLHLKVLRESVEIFGAFISFSNGKTSTLPISERWGKKTWFVTLLAGICAYS